MRPSRVVDDPVRRHARVGEAPMQGVVERDDHEVFHAQSFDPVHELVHARRVRVRDRREHLAIDRRLTQYVAQRLVPAAVHRPVRIRRRERVGNPIQSARAREGRIRRLWFAPRSERLRERVGVGQTHGTHRGQGDGRGDPRRFRRRLWLWRRLAISELFWTCPIRRGKRGFGHRGRRVGVRDAIVGSEHAVEP